MKIFFAMFAAILCAAVVIFGVYAYNRKRESDRASIAKALSYAVEFSRYAEHYAIEKDVPDHVFNEPIASLEAAAEVDTVTTIVLRARNDDVEFGPQAREILGNYRDLADFVESSQPTKKAWVNELRAKLDRLEAASK
jgi:hypothetical protein